MDGACSVCFKLFVAGNHSSRTWTSESFESVRWNVCVHRLDLSLYFHPKEFWGNGVRTHVNSKGKIPSTKKFFLRGGLNPQCCIKQDSEPNTLPMSCSGPHLHQLSVYAPPPPPPPPFFFLAHYWWVQFFHPLNMKQSQAADVTLFLNSYLRIMLRSMTTSIYKMKI